ncbi:MAG: oxidoreductase [Planctomycetes bacterium]|nr:oxidoreductase [Planctomycetota bacterium]
MCDCCLVEKDIFLPQPATVNETKQMNATEMYLHISMDEAPLNYVPGQFVEVSIPGFGEAPISISSSPTQADGFEIVVRKIGNVTNKIHQLKAGDKVGIRGAFGNGVYPVEDAKGKDLVFICGGIGLVPQRSFINHILDSREDYGQVTVLVGTKDYDQRLFHEELEIWQNADINFHETIDGPDERWDGNVGVVTTLIPEIKSDFADSVFFICGPPIMYKFVLMTLNEKNVPHENIFLNLERKMKCGVGKCGHCQMNDKYVCMEGPVFNYADLKNVPEAI